MAIAVSCTCGRQFRAKDDHAGRRTRCPACAAELVISGERLPDHDVFISYSSKDKLIADTVCARLEERRIRCWIAPRDIRPGMDWSSAIIDAIADSAVMVLLFTGNSNQSPQVLREVERAVNKGVSVVPLRLEETGLSKSMEYFISASHWLDAIAPPLEQHLEVLVTTIRVILARRKLNGGAPGDASGAPAGQPPRRDAGVAPSFAPQLQPGVGRRRAMRRWLVAGAAATLLVLSAGLVVWSVAGGWGRARASHSDTGATGTPTPATLPTTAHGRVVNLFPLIDVANDTVEGRWRFDQGRLVADATRFARIHIRYDPPPEYDFRIEFVRLQGQNDVTQMLEADGQRFAWQMAGEGGKLWGFDAVMGRIVPLKAPPRIRNGQRHVSLVQVRRGEVSAYFDGQLISRVQSMSSDFSLPHRWSMFGTRGLGLGTCVSPTVFYSAEVTELGDAKPATAHARSMGGR